MKGTELKLSGTRADIDPTQGPIVLMQFTGKGNKAFHEVTKNEATRGSIQQADQHFAIVLDNEIRSWPSISYKDLPNGIDPTGSGAQITGLASFNEASNLALVLQTGALPVNFVPLERTDVSATLGKDSLKQARNAAIGGLILVAVFLLLLYRFLGVVAVVGLAIYGAFMYAAIVLLGVTLTLPGFAGLILTIGVAADANVVVFERIKEEARAGKSVRAAIAAGLREGLPHDSRRERGHRDHRADPVRGRDRGRQGLRADAADRHRRLADHRRRGDTRDARPARRLPLVPEPSLHGRRRMIKYLQIDYMGRRKLWFAISGTVVLIGLVSLATRGLNLGIDFRGGVQITFKTTAVHAALEGALADEADRAREGRRRAGPRQRPSRAARATRTSRFASRS